MISIVPTNSEWVDITVNDWDACWALQFPEGVGGGGLTLKHWKSISVDWKKICEHEWRYEWRSSPSYIEERLNDLQKDSSGNTIKQSFTTGLALQAEIRARESELELSLTLVNETDEPITGAGSDGGCFQARSEQFVGNEEVARSHMFFGTECFCMKDLPRSNPRRCKYLTDLARYESAGSRRYEYFWGRSSFVIQSPVVVGAASADGTKAVAFGYEHSMAAMQNSDSHHCLHSCPVFGDIGPGSAVTRKGHILFGSDFRSIATELYGRINV